jgi:hypothetical protein
MGFHVAFALVPGPDGRQLVAWQVTDGQITVTFAGVEPDEIDGFADSLAATMKDAARQAQRANSGLVIPGANVDIGLLGDIQRDMAGRVFGAGMSSPMSRPPGHPG